MHFDQDELAEELTRAGFHQDEIYKALSWLEHLAELHDDERASRSICAPDSFRIYAPEDGVHMGLQGMINEVVQNADYDVADQGVPTAEQALAGLRAGDKRLLSRIITLLENGEAPALKEPLLKAAAELATPVLGITGTGGAGKSSLTDELVRRFRLDQGDTVKIGLISIDPSRKRTGGALLGDRIRMNAIEHPNIFMRSLATRDTGSEISVALPEVIAASKLAGFDLVIVETSGIGQGNAAIVPFVDLSLYVMTPEFGAASQLEKIDMLDFADFVAINKFDRKGAEDALRDVRKQYQRNREAFTTPTDDMPVFGTQAARFNDDGVTALYQALVPALSEKGLKLAQGKLPIVTVKQSSSQRAIVPAQRVRYLAEIADSVRGYHAHTEEQVKIARERQSLRIAKQVFAGCDKNVADFDEMVDLIAAMSPQRSRASVRRGVLANSRPIDGAFEWRYDDLSGLSDFAPLWEQVDGARVPLDLIRGSASSFVGDDDAVEFQTRAADVRVHEVEGAGHSVQSDRPVELAGILRGIIDRT